MERHVDQRPLINKQLKLIIVELKVKIPHRARRPLKHLQKPPKLPMLNQELKLKLPVLRNLQSQKVKKTRAAKPHRRKKVKRK